ncbi:hypothetical protein PG994_006061 [Apiospora phragmitis]|uniref:Uncharacterized protein n=1 Tax=Apiospora phragmitis TaxID=2905665 RepID=A0ABR1VE03_9PEZI
MSPQDVGEQRKLRKKLEKEDRRAKVEAIEVGIPEKETVPWKTIQTNPETFSPWLSKRITSFGELDSWRQNAAFVAYDTKWRQWKDPANPAQQQYSQCLEVGWALLVNLGQRENISTTKDLVRQFDIQVKNSQVNGWYRDSLRATVQDFPFGVTDHVDLEGLDEKVDSHLQYFKEQARERPLILIGFNVRRHLPHFWRNFPTGARHFPAWVDLDDLFRNSSLSRAPTMGLGVALRALGYDAIETADTMRGIGQGKRHVVAAMEAVRTLALLEVVTRPNDDEVTRLLLGRVRTSRFSGCPMNHGHTLLKDSDCRSQARGVYRKRYLVRSILF